LYSTAFHTIDISTKKFLITGGAGFIGSHLTEYLMTHGAGSVVVIDNLVTGQKENIGSYMSSPSFKFVHDDINDHELMISLCRDSDYVLHQAALGSVPRSIKNPLDSHLANATGFLSVLEACRIAGVKRLVYASSSSVYGDSQELPKKEENLGLPKSPYAVTKLMDEQYAQLYSRLHGMDITGLRYFNIFGPRQNPNGPYAAAIPLFIIAALKGESPKIFGDGEQTRDFTFVVNAVKANILALFAEPETCGKAYNVACGKQYSLNNVLDKISEIGGLKIKAMYLDERGGDIKHSKADISLIQRLLNFTPDIQLEEGLGFSMEWYKKNVQNFSSSPIGQ
jgi:UDP-N-acetylglucosamine 4-epimerase